MKLQNGAKIYSYRVITISHTQTSNVHYTVIQLGNQWQASDRPETETHDTASDTAADATMLAMTWMAHNDVP